jgi:two-component sensor histidine kinase
MNEPRLENVASPSPNGRSADDIAKEFFPHFATVRTALAGTRIGIWSLDIATGALTWSSNLEDMHRLESGSFDRTVPGFLDAVHPEDRNKVDEALREAMRSRAAFKVRYRLPERPDGAECWLELNGSLACNDGAAERMYGLCCDTTERVELETELRTRVKQQEALAQLGERALAAADLEHLLNDAVTTVATVLAVDFVKILELLPGSDDLLLRAGFGWKPELFGTTIASADPGSYGRFTLDSPLPVVTEDFAAERRFRVDDFLHQHGCVSGINVVIAGRDERFYGILGVCTKKRRAFTAQETAFLGAIANLLAGAIARRQLEQRHELMIRDMRHRSGNLFSQLLALFSQTARNSKSIADLSSKYRARVLALASAQRLITEGGGASIPIMDLLYTLLGPYLDHITFKGPNVELESDPVFNLSAALHELADNAIKHGSLSRQKGQLELSWTVTRTGRGATLALDWVEKNGPPTRRPRKLGFGSRLISLVIERQLNGEVTRTFGRKGLSVHMVVPLTHERWPTPADGAEQKAGAEKAGAPSFPPPR